MSHDVSYELVNFVISRTDVQKKFRPKKFITTKLNLFETQFLFPKTF